MRFLPHRLTPLAKSAFWFCIGGVLGFFFFVSFGLIIFQKLHEGKIYEGISVQGINFGGKTKEDVAAYFQNKNEQIADTKIVFEYASDQIATTARKLELGYNTLLLADQAYYIGRSNDRLTNLSLILESYLHGLNLPASYSFSQTNMKKLIQPITENVYKEPVNALFNFQDGRVITFRPSNNGQEVDLKAMENEIAAKIFSIVSSREPQTVTIAISLKTTKPEITTDKVNDLGITELIGEGRSLFQGSIPNRIFNITLASTRLNGILVAPNETFSMAKALGDVSSFTGYKQAFIIQNGRTILGDGGGVCQVSTTLFRAALNAGLPIIERNAHSYRVGYYEQDSPPGIDASVYVPTVDFKFTNDTNHHILIQTTIDPVYQQLSFQLYGTKDGREVIIGKPVITGQAPAPAPLYQDDPTIQKGQLKQIDFAAVGANVYFTRQVSKNGKVIISDKFVSNYRPWQAVYLRGTKE